MSQDGRLPDGGPGDGGPAGSRSFDKHREQLQAEAIKTFELEVSAGRSAKIPTPSSTEIRAALSAHTPAASRAAIPAPRLAEIPFRFAARAEEVSLLSPTVAQPEVETSPPRFQPGFLAGDSDAAITSQPSTLLEAGVSEPLSAGAAHGPADLTRSAEDGGSSQLQVTSPALLPTWLARRQSSWWIVSLGVHALVLVLLAFSTLVVLHEPEQLELYTSPAVYETVEEFVDLDVDPADELESLEADIASELDEPEAAAFADLASETLSDQAALSESTLSESAAVQLTGSLGEMGQLFGESGNGMSEMGSGTGAATARFFGTEVKARRILYMLDNSGGMLQGGKFESLVGELQASINVLDAKQQFYVIFFSDTVYPLFYPQSVRKFMPATDRNRQQLQRWLESVELCTGNAIDEALAAAEVIRPDAVFLLTDGNLFTTEQKKAQLLNPAGRQYAIHTFGLGVGEQTETAEGLKQVAEANQGTFRAITVSAESKQLAKEKQRPYHSKLPGPVWGLKVGLR